MKTVRKKHLAFMVHRRKGTIHLGEMGNNILEKTGYVLRAELKSSILQAER